MKLYYEELIDSYHCNELTDNKKELFICALMFLPQLRKEYTFHIKLMYAIMDIDFLQITRNYKTFAS